MKFKVTAVLSVLLVLNCLHCAGTVSEKDSAKRIIHCKAVVDPTFSKVTQYPIADITNLMRKLAEDFEMEFDIHLQLDTIVHFDANINSCADMDQRTCYMLNTIKGNEDITIQFFGQYVTKETDFVGFVDFELNHIVVAKVENTHIDLSFQYTYNILFRAMCTMFGAIPVYEHGESYNLLEKRIHREERSYAKEGKTLKMKQPILDPGNRAIILGMANRPFKRNEWTPLMWNSVQNLYNKQVRQYNSSKIDARGTLTDFADNVFWETDRYIQMGEIAALCGNDTAARAYMDSVLLYISALRGSCIDDSKLGALSRDICKQHNLDIATTENFGRFNMARVMLILGKYDFADLYIREMIANGVKIPDINWFRKQQLYENEKVIWQRINQN